MLRRCDFADFDVDVLLRTVLVELGGRPTARDASSSAMALCLPSVFDELGVDEAVEASGSLLLPVNSIGCSEGMNRIGGWFIWHRWNIRVWMLDSVKHFL